MRQREIPASGEEIGAIGLGTWQTFDVGTNAGSRAPLKEVLSILAESGGSLIDSSPMYGSSERVVGDLAAETGRQDDFFYATKVWTTGESRGVQQMQSSFQKMRRKQMDLMQIHNLQDWKTHLKTLYQWKEEGKVRYIGITHYVDAAHHRLEQIIKTHSIDFVQVNYSMAESNAEHSLLNTAKDRGVAVIANRPYAGGSLFRKVKAQKLPVWASELDCASWGQFFLKYILAHPAMTCVIPGTSKPHHMRDNVQAGFGRLPTADERRQMKKFIESI
ncbi:MAG: aldo/keto reductase [Ekhidna sp.]